MIQVPCRRPKRSKSRQSFDLDGPAIGSAALQQDSVYRIFQPKGQTQIVRAEYATDLGRLMSGQSEDLSASVGGPIGGFHDPCGLAGADGGGGFFEP